MDFEVLRARLGAGLIKDGEPGYDEARQVWNAMIDRRPAVIAKCQTPEDVSTALETARSAGLPVSIRGGGHNIAGSAVGDGTVMIDLSAMQSVVIDPGRRGARGGGGTTWAAVDAEAQRHGLATPGGGVSSTGVSGLTLGGGFGWLARQHGRAIDNLIALEIVLADGRI
ncbi:MAG: FAD-binding oxidoreductase, partial [Paracoccaceae bacterium]